jgi:glucose-1-phosphate adenylyltransferase
MIEQHRDNNAKLTIATQEVPWEETSRFGIMVTDPRGRITQFQEKPKVDPLSNKASLGIYVFDRDCLLEALREDAIDAESTHDFGGDIIPRLIQSEPVYHYNFADYWRDVGTIPSYVATSMEVLSPATSGLDLGGWGVRTNHNEISLRHQHAVRLMKGSCVQQSLICQGSVVEGEVSESILSPGVHIGRGAIVRRSILLHDVHVGEGTVLEDVIADKHVRIGRGIRIGEAALGDDPNDYRPLLLNQGTTVLGKGAELADGTQLGRNSLVAPYVQVAPGVYPSGATLLETEA